MNIKQKQPQHVDWQAMYQQRHTQSVLIRIQSGLMIHAKEVLGM